MLLQKLNSLGITKAIQLSRFFQIHPKNDDLSPERKQILNEVIEASSWLPENSSYAHRWYVIENSLSDYPKCQECGSPIVWNPKQPTEINRPTCGRSCASKIRQRENKETYSIAAKKGHATKNQKEIGRKISETRLSFSKEKLNSVNLKMVTTKANNGFIIPQDQVSDWQRYSRLVRNMTAKQDCSTLKNYHLKGLCGVDGAYQLDHKISIYDGFKNNIPVHIIGDISNLQMLPWKENRSKGIASWSYIL